MPQSTALIVLTLTLLWGTVSRVLIFRHGYTAQRRNLVHFALGSAYELALSCGYALLLYALALVSNEAAVWTGFAWVVFLLVFNFVDYRYFLEFQTHLPFSTKEYLQEFKSLKSSLGGVLFTWNFLLMVLLPGVLAAWLLPGNLWAGFWGDSWSSGAGWGVHGAWMGGLLFVGLAANVFSNRYVTKNLHNPLQFPPIKYFVKTRKLASPKPITLPPGFVERMAKANGAKAALPFLRERDYRKVAGAEATSAQATGTPGPLEGLRRTVAGRKKPPNIVFVMLESFRAAEIGVYEGLWADAPSGITPRFDALAETGLLFTDFFANSFQTRHALLASYCSTYPNYGPSVLRYHPHLKLRSLAHTLGEQGFHTAWIHNADADFDRMREFLTRNGFDTLVDEHDYPLFTERLGWGVSDEALMEKAVEVLKETPQPFFASLLTISNHHPYEVPKHFRQQRAPGEYGRYLDAMTYTDHALGRLMELAAGQPFFEDTLFFIYADSSNHHPVSAPIDTLRAQLYLDHHIPLLVWAPWMKKGAKITAPGSQVDLPPTVHDLLGLKDTVPWVGQSFLSEKSGSASPDSPQPHAIVHKPDQYFGLITPDGAAVSRGPLQVRGSRVDGPPVNNSHGETAWEVEGDAPTEVLRRQARDLLALNRWAIEQDKFVG